MRPAGPNLQAPRLNHGCCHLCGLCCLDPVHDRRKTSDSLPHGCCACVLCICGIDWTPNLSCMGFCSLHLPFCFLSAPSGMIISRLLSIDNLLPAARPHLLRAPSGACPVESGSSRPASCDTRITGCLHHHSKAWSTVKAMGIQARHAWQTPSLTVEGSEENFKSLRFPLFSLTSNPVALGHNSWASSPCIPARIFVSDDLQFAVIQSGHDRNPCAPVALVAHAC